MTTQSSSLFRLSCFCLLSLAACTPGQEPIGVRPNPASVGKIGFRFAPDSSGVSATASQRKEWAARVSKNLGGWGYPVEAGDGDYSHILEARIGKVEHKSTPTGLSFSIGNSDPRAPEFQKADVLPVDCVLYPAGRPQEVAHMYMDFVAGSDATSPENLVNHAGTVCFNLLGELKLARAQAPAGTASTPGSPSWMPEVRIEVVEKPVPGSKPVVPAAATPVSPPNPASKPATPVAQPPAEPSVQTESRTGGGRKQIIIHNQGAPVILEFGYERK